MEPLSDVAVREGGPRLELVKGPEPELTLRRGLLLVIAATALTGVLAGLGRLGVQEVCDGSSVACPANTLVTAPNSFPSTGANGAYNATSNTTLAGGTYNFTTFTIASGVTVTVTGSTPLDIRVQGAANIQGTLDLSGGAGGASPGNNDG